MRNHTRTVSPAVGSAPVPGGQRPTARARIGRMLGRSSSGCAPAIPTTHPARGIRRCWPLTDHCRCRRDKPPRSSPSWARGPPTRSTSKSPSPKSPTNCPPKPKRAQSLAHYTRIHNPRNSASPRTGGNNCEYFPEPICGPDRLTCNGFHTHHPLRRRSGAPPTTPRPSAACNGRASYRRDRR